MTREEAIEILKEEKVFQNTLMDDSVFNAIDVAIKALEQKSETVTEFADRCRECGARYGRLLKQTRWISVSERLPKSQEDGDSDFTDWVQVSIRINAHQSMVCSAYYCFSETKWYTERITCGEVVAWMPLPEPCKAEDNLCDTNPFDDNRFGG